MGAIQNAVNSSLSGTAFLLNQSGALDKFKEQRAMERRREQTAKKINLSREAGKAALEAIEYKKTKLTKKDTNNEPQINVGEVTNEARNEIIENFKSERADIRNSSGVPEYEMRQAKYDAYRAVNSIYAEAKEKAIASLAEANAKKAEAEKVKQERLDYLRGGDGTKFAGSVISDEERRGILNGRS